MSLDVSQLIGVAGRRKREDGRCRDESLFMQASRKSFNANAASFLDQAQALFLQQSGDPSAARQLALQSLENLRQQQASSLAYFDVFLLLAVATLAPLFAVLLMKRSIAEKGARIGGE